jgi:hypothetical protein
VDIRPHQLIKLVQDPDRTHPQWQGSSTARGSQQSVQSHGEKQGVATTTAPGFPSAGTSKRSSSSRAALDNRQVDRPTIPSAAHGHQYMQIKGNPSLPLLCRTHLQQLRPPCSCANTDTPSTTSSSNSSWH